MIPRSQRPGVKFSSSSSADMESCVLLFFCILSSLVTTGSSLSCSVCSGEDGMSCKGTSTMCPSETDVCVATYETSSLDGKEMSQYRRACGPRTLCAQKDSSTFPNGVVKITSSCCYTSNCIPPTPMWPQILMKNSISCMACQGSGDKPCTSSSTMDCIGDEIQCVSLVVTTPSVSTESLSGCGTSGMCNVTEVNIKAGDLKQQLKFSCQSGGSGLQHSLLLLIFAPVLLVKVIG